MNIADMELEKIDVAALTQGKAEQLSADALLGGPLDITITRLRAGPSEEQPLALEYAEGPLPYLPCLSMRRLLIGIWGPQLGQWKGRRLRLYRDSGVNYGGQKVSGIRISHMSDIPASGAELLLSQGRGKKLPWRVQPLPSRRPPASTPPAHGATAPAAEAAELAALRKEARASAARGTEALKSFWAVLEKDEKAALKVELERDWKPLAEQADAATAAAQAAADDDWEVAR